jgi:hypothetical protein
MRFCCFMLKPTNERQRATFLVGVVTAKEYGIIEGRQAFRKGLIGSPFYLRPYLAAMLGIASAWTFATPTIRASDRHIQSIVFQFRRIQVNGRCAFHVNESFRVLSPETEILVPTHWGGAAHPEDRTQNLKVDSPGATLADHSTEHAAKLLQAHAGQRIDLNYDIVSQQTEWFAHPQEHMAVMNEDYFLFNPQNALVYPEMSPSSEVEVTFDWRALPKDTRILTSFGIDQRVTHVRAVEPHPQGVLCRR